MNKEKELIEPMIFDDDSSSSSFIPNKRDKKEKELITPMEIDIRTKSFEEKTYIILYKLDNDDDVFDYVYSICSGRTSAYNDIMTKLQSLGGETIDIHKSKVITETKQTESSSGNRKYYLIPYDEAATVYAFCKNVEEYYMYNDFNIEDYNNLDVEKKSSEDSDQAPEYMTAEQINYKRMLEESMRNKYNTYINTSDDNDKGFNI